jgi:hypothetical protein
MNNEKQVTITLPDGQTAAKIVNFVVKKRPHGWSRRSYATYYKESYALWLKKDIDQMILDRQPIVYRYDKWPNIKAAGLYLRITQAMMYLLDELDTNNVYHKFREQIRIKRKKGAGIVISFDDVLGDEPQGERFIADEDKPTWYKKMYDYLENVNEVKPLHIDGLLLSPEQIEALQAELEGLSNILFTISSREIKIIKGS